MELTKTKFKQTEVGLIPEDWEFVPFNSIFSFYSTSNYSKAQMSEDDEVGCIHYGLIHAIKNTNYSLKNGVKYYVTSEQAKYELIRDGDVIMVDASEDLEGINKSVEVFGVGNNKYISGLHTYLLRDKKSLLADNFRGIILNSQSVKNQMLQLAVGMKVFGVSKTQLVKVKLPLPPLPEQKAIAQVLSDTDSLIQTLELKLTKKRAIKQGAMQQLLTPKEGWEVRSLGEIGNIITGSTPSTLIKSFWNGNIPWITPTDISNTSRDIKNSEREITDKGLKAIRKLPPNTLLVTCIASIGKNAILRVTGSCNQQINAIIPNNDFNVEFIYYLIENNKKLILSKAGITATLMVSKKVFSEIEFKFPDFREQTRIATILSDMDAEIGQLEQKLDKYKLLKQGLMQELLTGGIRLV